MNSRIYVSEETMLHDLKNEVTVKPRMSILADGAAALGTDF